MGRDKALLPVGGRPLALIAAAALRDAGAREVLAVGGDQAALEALGLLWIPDDGRHPLDGMVAALRSLSDDVVVVLACDLPFVVGDAIRAVVDGLGDADVALPVAGKHDQVLLAAYRRAPALAAAEDALADGAQAPRDLLASLSVHRLELADPQWAANANTPADLPT
jgi:molybdopterin-guanine dinucleotide biosynthesis protein A